MCGFVIDKKGAFTTGPTSSLRLLRNKLCKFFGRIIKTKIL